MAHIENNEVKSDLPYGVQHHILNGFLLGLIQQDSTLNSMDEAQVLNDILVIYTWVENLEADLSKSLNVDKYNVWQYITAKIWPASMSDRCTMLDNMLNNVTYLFLDEDKQVVERSMQDATDSIIEEVLDTFMQLTGEYLSKEDKERSDEVLKMFDQNRRKDG
jgi:hypothetical protein